MSEYRDIVNNIHELIGTGNPEDEANNLREILFMIDERLTNLENQKGEDMYNFGERHTMTGPQPQTHRYDEGSHTQTISAGNAREMAIPSSVKQLQLSVERIGGLVIKLKDRLEPVLMEISPQNKACGCPPDPQFPPLGDEIRRNTKVIESIADTLEDILGRLEI